jgi:hypothetical protein
MIWIMIGALALVLILRYKYVHRYGKPTSSEECDD